VGCGLYSDVMTFDDLEPSGQRFEFHGYEIVECVWATVKLRGHLGDDFSSNLLTGAKYSLNIGPNYTTKNTKGQKPQQSCKKSVGIAAGLGFTLPLFMSTDAHF